MNFCGPPLTCRAFLMSSQLSISIQTITVKIRLLPPIWYSLQHSHLYGKHTGVPFSMASHSYLTRSFKTFHNPSATTLLKKTNSIDQFLFLFSYIIIVIYIFIHLLLCLFFFLHPPLNYCIEYLTRSNK